MKEEHCHPLLDKGLDNPAGFTLPLKWNYDNNKWQSCKWVLNRKHLFLIPGNSPIGLRLPLDSLPAVAKENEPQKVERSLFEELPALENYHETITSRYGLVYEHPAPKQKIKSQDKCRQAIKDSEKKKIIEEEEIKPLYEIPVIKTHFVWKQGKESFIFFFLRWITWNIISIWWHPLKPLLKNYNMPVRIEGYEPPRDYRMERLVVSPDPGCD